MAIDIMTNAEPPLVQAGLPAELPAAGIPATDAPITPLDLIEGTKIRTKLRLYAILFALYVTSPNLVFYQCHLANDPA